MAKGKEMKTLSPVYMRHFHCIGPDCTDHCCYGWNITIDKKTYLKYKAITDPELAQIVKASVKRTQGEQMSGNNYAYFVIKGNDNCPFQDERGLCMLHGRLGEKSLCMTCQLYPRKYRIFDYEEQHKSLNMSCIEAARQALLDPAPMEFSYDLDEYDIARENAELYSHIYVQTAPPGFEKMRHLMRVMETCIDIMQCRRRSVEDRLVILGLFCRGMDEAVQAGRPDEIAAVAEVYASNVGKDIYKNAFDSIASIAGARVSVLQALFTKISGNRSRVFGEVLKAAMKGFEFDETGINRDKLEETLKRGVVEKYLPFLERCGHVMENYIVNYIFTFVFPFMRPDESFTDNFVTLSALYLTLKFLLTGYALSLGGEMTAEDAVKVISCTVRAFEHNSANMKDILEIFKQSGLNGVPFLAAVIKEA